MKRYVGVVGASSASRIEYELALEVGRLIAKRGWVLVNGGLGGVMEAASKGAKEEGGLVVGILPGATKDDANAYVDIAIVTNMGHARNVVIAHTAECLVAVGGGEGTLSEIAIARKLGKTVASLRSYDVAGVVVVQTPEDAVEVCSRVFDL